MSDEFDQVFGRGAPPITFSERVGRPSPSPAEPATDGGAHAGYRAFGALATDGVGETCDVRRWVKGTDVPEGLEFPYRLLMQVSYVGDEQLRLMLPDCIIVVEGRGLTALRQKLARRQATFVQQWHPAIWPMPAEGEAWIEQIQIIRPESIRTG